MRDTSPEVLRIQALAQRGLGGAERFRLACRMSQTIREMARQRIASKHPDLDELGISDVLLRELYGIERKP